MKQFLAAIALAGLMVGCNTAQQDMGGTSTDTGTVSGSDTNGSSTLTNGTTIDTNTTINGSNQQNSTPTRDGSQSGNQP